MNHAAKRDYSQYRPKPSQHVPVDVLVALLVVAAGEGPFVDPGDIRDATIRNRLILRGRSSGVGIIRPA